MTDKLVVAFLGTGIMGRAMAVRLLDAGFPLRAWNRTPARAAPLAEAGAVVAESPDDAVSGADVVITMMDDADAVLSVMRRALAAMGPDAVWVQMSTVGVDGCARLAAAADEAGVAFLDAPVLGTRTPAEEGTLKVLAAGPAELRERCAPVLAALGTVFGSLSEVGQGSALKLVANSWILALTGGVANSIQLAQHLDVDPQLFLDVIAGTLSDSAYLHLKGAAIRNEDYTTSFAVTGAAKDAGLIVQAGRDAGYEPTLIEVLRQQLQRAAERGHADKDMAAIYFGLS